MGSQWKPSKFFTGRFCVELNAGRVVASRFANINGLLRLVLTACDSTRSLLSIVRSDLIDGVKS